MYASRAIYPTRVLTESNDADAQQAPPHPQQRSVSFALLSSPRTNTRPAHAHRPARKTRRLSRSRAWTLRPVPPRARRACVGRRRVRGGPFTAVQQVPGLLENPATAGEGRSRMRHDIAGTSALSPGMRWAVVCPACGRGRRGGSGAVGW